MNGSALTRLKGNLGKVPENAIRELNVLAGLAQTAMLSNAFREGQVDLHNFFAGPRASVADLD
jgi:hypothetical protein